MDIGMSDLVNPPQAVYKFMESFQQVYFCQFNKSSRWVVKAIPCFGSTPIQPHVREEHDE